MPDPKLQIILAAKDITGQALTKFQGRIAAIIKSVFSFRGALGALTGAGGLGILVTSSLEAADAIGKTAAKLGITTDALQEYRYAAERSGVETATLDMALQRFTRRVAEAAQEKGELRGVLEQYNIAVRDAAGNTRRTEDVFRDLADVIQRTQDPAERLRIAFKAFDSEGAALVNMLRDGSIGLDEFARRARRLGIILNDDLIGGSVRARDVISDLGKVIETNFSRVVLENIESITAAVEKLAGASSKVIQAFTGPSEMNQAIARFNEISERIAEIEKSNAPGKEGMLRGLNSALDRARKKMEQLFLPWDRANTKWNLLQKTVSGGSRTEPAAQQPSAGRSRGVFGVPVVEAFPAFYPADFADTWQRSFDSIDGIMQDFKQKQQQQSQELLDSWSAGYGDEFVDMFDRSFGEVNEIVAQSSAKMLELTERTAGAMQSNFSDFFFDAMQGEFKSLQDYADGFFQSISRAMADFTSQQLIEGLFGDLTKAGGGGGLLSRLFSAQGNIFTPQGLKPFSSGGVVASPTVFPFTSGVGLMGERGPEAIMPLKRTSSGDLGVQSTGGVSVVVNNYSGMAANVQQRRDVNGKKVYMVEIGNDILSGGPIDRAIKMRYGLSPAGKIT